MKSAKRAASKPAKSAGTAKAKTVRFTAEERAAMQEYIQEKKGAARRPKGADQEAEVVAKIAALPQPDRTIGQRLHAIIKANAPSLSPTTWYGMPAYARDGKILCFFQSAQKFKTRYGTLGFSDKARLDDGGMWPTAFALKDLTGAEEARIIALLKKAVG